MATKQDYKFVTYPVGDFLIRIKNAAMGGARFVEVRSTKLLKAVADTLKKMGYLESVNLKGGILTVELAFHKKQPLLIDLKLVSKPGLRVYKTAAALAKQRGPSSYILSTSRGLMTTKEAVKARVGGEVIVELW